MGFYNNLCPNCMNEIGEAEKCPYCDFDTKTKQVAPYLAYGTVLAAKYVVGEVLEQNCEGVTYLALDTITNNCVRIREFLPESLCTRKQDELKVSIDSDKASEFKELKLSFLNMWHKIMKIKTLDTMIAVLDVFETNDTAYAVAEADGSKTLSEYLEEKGGTIKWEEIKEKIFPVLDSLDALHKLGVIHGAVSPDTLFLCGNGQFKLWGFSVNECRKKNDSLGTDIIPGYAAIEQYGYDGELTEKTDVYGFISVLYKCVTSRMPIPADERAIEDNLEIPAVYAKALPDYVLAAFIGALQLNPEDRTGSISLLKASFTKEAFERHKKQSSSIATASLIDPISDITPTDTATPEKKETVIVAATPEVPVLTKNNPGKTTSTASTVILSLSIVVVMIIFFACLALTGFVSFNFSGSTASVVEMPNFENYKKDDAYIAQVAETYGLHITLQPSSSSTVAKDVIFEQDVAAGTMIARGSEVVLTYSKGASTVTLPNFIGVPFTETVYYLGQLNLSYNIVEKENPGNQTPGYVASMSPGAGSIVYEETEITIEIWGDVASESDNGDTVGSQTGSEITSSTSILDSIFGSLSDSVSGLGSTIQSFFD